MATYYQQQLFYNSLSTSCTIVTSVKQHVVAENCLMLKSMLSIVSC